MPNPPARPEPITNPTTYKAEKPVWWLVAIKDEKTGKIYSSRWSTNKWERPGQAYHDAYGAGTRFSANVLFFNLGSSLAEARKINRAIGFHANSYQ